MPKRDSAKREDSREGLKERLKSVRPRIKCDLIAALKERDEVRKMLQNKYYWNNYSMHSRRLSEQERKLVNIRLPLREMVEADADFKKCFDSRNANRQ